MMIIITDDDVARLLPMREWLGSDLTAYYKAGIRPSP